jgi:uncharacterized protein (TIGR03067 family)
MNCSRRLLAMPLGLCLVLLNPGDATRLGAGDKKKIEPISAEQITRVYAEKPDEFNNVYTGKTVTVEGIVSNSGVKGDNGKVYLMIRGYTKPGARVAHSVRCLESGPDFEGIRQGHKVRIRSTVQPHKETLYAAELRDCTVIKVFDKDYPPTKAARLNAKKLRGKWKVVSAEENGKKLLGKQMGFDALSIEGYTIYLHQGNRAFAFGLAFDPEKTPKNLELTGGKAALPCIYSLEGDRLRLFLPGQKKTAHSSARCPLIPAKTRASC